MIHHSQLHKHQNCTVILPHNNHQKGEYQPNISTPVNHHAGELTQIRCVSEVIKVIPQVPKGTLKCKASKLIKAILPKKKKKKAPDGDTMSLSSAEESDNGNGNTNSHDPRQPEVIDIDGDDNNEKSDDGTEEDAEAELGRSFFF
jgi:hypothetical protein